MSQHQTSIDSERRHLRTRLAASLTSTLPAQVTRAVAVAVIVILGALAFHAVDSVLEGCLVALLLLMFRRAAITERKLEVLFDVLGIELEHHLYEIKSAVGVPLGDQTLEEIQVMTGLLIERATADRYFGTAKELLLIEALGGLAWTFVRFG